MSIPVDQQAMYSPTSALRPLKRPRLGFLGVGWIGRHRLQAVADSGLADVCAIADQSESCRDEAAMIIDNAALVTSLDELLEHDLDGVVIATPSAGHADQSLAVLKRGISVFCQKPLARTGAETRAIVEAAREKRCLLGVDLSYRYVKGASEMRELVRTGALGRVYAADLVFHNAYGPDKAWFYDPQLSGGGCVMDLGTHLVDLALWMLDFPAVESAHSQLFAQGAPLADRSQQVEDYATADLRTSGNVAVRLACSWRLPAGCDAVISAQFFGTEGAVTLRNINGSFYDFVVEHCKGTAREQISGPPDDWGGRAILDWVQRLSIGSASGKEAEHFIETAAALDRIYETCAS